MTEQNTHINYTAEDIERYLKGKMAAKEMHDMEKAALQDPFLADAIEGYTEISFEEANKHLNEITAALQMQKEETKVIPLPTKSFYWWRVAAMIVLVIGVGVLSWYIVGSNNSNSKSKGLANVKENKTTIADSVREMPKEVIRADSSAAMMLAEINAIKEKEKRKNIEYQQRKSEKVLNEANEQNAKVLYDRVGNLNKALHDLNEKQNDKDVKQGNAGAATLLAKQKEEDTIKLIPDSSMKEIALAAERRPTQILNAPALEKINNKSISDTVFFNFKAQRSLNTFNGRVLDNNNQPIPYATIATNNKQATTSDVNGFFKVQAPDTALNVTVSSVGFVSANTQLKTYSPNNISIQPDKTALSEVAITGYSTQQKPKKNITDSAYPAGGWESFQAYVYKRSKKPIDTTGSAVITGDVELEFLIDAYGTPYDFSVLKSSNDGNTSKAIEIVKEGPKWISAGKNNKGKVTIRF